MVTNPDVDDYTKTLNHRKVLRISSKKSKQMITCRKPN